MPMRRLFITLLCGLVVVPVAAAASHATGDGVLELKSADGAVSIGTNAQPARGALWGQLDSGTLTVYDPLAGDGQIYVTGWEHKQPTKILSTGGTVTTYSGTNLHFRVTGGLYRFTFTNATSLDLTAVGVGVAYLQGDPTLSNDPNFDPGSYSLDSGKWLPMPVNADGSAKKVPFGIQTPTTTTTPSTP